MNSDETWLLYMWSGVFSSAIGGAVAAIVAMLVLRKTNKHQSTLATTQLAGQRNDLERQLMEQRQGLELQLREQRAEASNARETAAIADMLAAIAQLESNCMDGDRADNERLHLAFESATIRWEMELDHEAMADEIQDWHFLTRKLVLMARWEKDWNQGTVFRDALNTASHGLAFALKGWPKANGQRRDRICSVIRAERELAMEPIDKDIARRATVQSTAAE